MSELSSILAYRGFVFYAIKRDIQAKYINSVMGGLWVLISPLATITLYMVIFGEIMKARLPNIGDEQTYPIYLCVGIISWGLFFEIVSRSQGVFLEYRNVLKTQRFPRVSLLLIVSGGAVVNFLIVFGVFLVFLALTGKFPGVQIIAVVPVLIVQLVFAFGIGMIAAVLNVFFRDISHASGLMLQFWFWLTPIVYPIGVIPEGVRDLIYFNPLTSIIAGYQVIFVEGNWPSWSALGFVSAQALLLCLGGYKLYLWAADELVDAL